MIIYASIPRGELSGGEKRGLKKLKKVLEKVLTKGMQYDILFELSRKNGIAIGP